MIGTMPPVAPENAPHLRMAPRLLAGAVIMAVSALLAGAVWFLAPTWAPGMVVEYSPWPDPVMRTAVAQEARSPDTGWSVLSHWARREDDKYRQLLPYLRSPDPRMRLVTVGAMLDFVNPETLVPIERALIPLLDDPDPEIRRLSAMRMFSADCIPALEAHRHDPNEEVANTVAHTLEMYRIFKLTPTPGASP